MSGISSAPVLLLSGHDEDPVWETVQKLLKYNHEKYHVFFQQVEDVLLHNHLPHHALTLFSLGATKEQIQSHFCNHTTYQADIPTSAPEVYGGLSVFSNFKLRLAQPKQYKNFLFYFEQEMKKNGYEKTVNRFLFANDEISDEIFPRLFTGFLHPLINAGFGFEFDIPFLVCEGLAMACAQNDGDVVSFMNAIEASVSKDQERLGLVDILDLCASDWELVDAVPMDPFHMLDTKGVLGSQATKVIDYTRRFVVREDEVTLRSAELCNATSFMLAGAQRQGKEPRMDFFILHATNTSILVNSIVNKPWIDSAGKARLLAWFGRYCIILYLVLGCPNLDLSIVRNYKPPTGLETWQEVIACAKEYKDDGHGCKMIRALIHAEHVSKLFEERAEFRMKGSDFEKAAIAVVSSFLPNNVVERAGYDKAEAWVRFAGFDRAWEDVPELITV